jgi:hypothetical protein
VDEPEEVVEPRLTWKAGGRSYWISTHINEDFRLATEVFKRGTGIFLVPIYSPEVMSFLGWAEHLLRLPGGTATVLCNCVGMGAKGQSGVVALNPDGKPFQAAFELSTTKEQVSVFEIDLQHLSPPKRISKERAYPLGRMLLYDVQVLPDSVQLRQVPKRDDNFRRRGVINPAIFDLLGKKMRIAFLKVLHYAELDERVKGKEYEVLAILGKEDVMVTHLAAERYDMIYDVTQAITWIGIKGNTVTPQSPLEIDEDNFPHFRVDVYYKVLGVNVTEKDRRVFTTQGNPFPNLREIENIFKLGQNWEDTDVTDEDRTRFRKLRWILDTTENAPGQINAVMTIRLQHARSEGKLQLLTTFEEKVLPALMDDPQIKSLYRGTSPGMGIDYVARLSSGIGEISNLQYQLHSLAQKVRMLIDIQTYIIHRTLATLSLPKAILITPLPGDLKRYRNQRINPHLSTQERVRLIYQSEKEQQDFANQLRPVDEALEEIGYLELEEDAKAILLRRLTRGLFNKNFNYLKDVHDPLYTRVERLLTDFVEAGISNAEFAQLKAKEKIQSQKEKSQLYYTERVRIVARHFEEIGEYPEALTTVKALNSTAKVRNAFAHSDWTRLSIKETVDALVEYCRFISTWERIFGKDETSGADEDGSSSEPLT